jgi:hypothetical protein
MVNFNLFSKSLMSLFGIVMLQEAVCRVKAFLFSSTSIVLKTRVLRMKKEEMKIVVDTVNELSEGYADLAQVLSDTTREAKATKQLWRTGSRSWLIKVGMTLIAFPDPTISDVVGGLLVAAGVVQEGVRRRTLHVDDVYKTFQKTMRELRSTKESF